MVPVLLACYSIKHDPFSFHSTPYSNPNTSCIGNLLHVCTSATSVQVEDSTATATLVRRFFCCYFTFDTLEVSIHMFLGMARSAAMYCGENRVSHAEKGLRT